ncbi:uncharacterized protein LOC143273403 [Peromyscus maniculatus bairdii]|uniref:uncharacterized protein LOC143273403 n=1 Tax=Peromyscus maniculatus bairdii TaxID=230844 RepID=UPI003FD394C3
MGSAPVTATIRGAPDRLGREPCRAPNASERQPGRAPSTLGSLRSLSAARPRPGSPPPSRHAPLRSRPRPSEEPAAAFTSALWSDARSLRCKKIPTRHGRPASASSHPRPLSVKLHRAAEIQPMRCKRNISFLL